MLKWFTWAFVLFILYVVIAADMGAMPEAFHVIDRLPGRDRLGHFLLIGTLAFLVNMCLYPRTVPVGHWRILTGTVVVLTLVTLEEFSQKLFATRSFDLLDLGADYLGIITAEVIVRCWKRPVPRANRTN
jgi:polysaccharide biosynthesis protein VpsQ